MNTCTECNQPIKPNSIPGAQHANGHSDSAFVTLNCSPGCPKNGQPAE